MPVPEIAESYTGSVNRVTIGATQDDGGTRTSTVTVGGARNVVYGGSVEDASDKPVIAMDVLDTRPDDWPDVLLEPYRDVLDSPGDWAAKCVEEFGAELICLKFDGHEHSSFPTEPFANCPLDSSQKTSGSCPSHQSRYNAQ